MDAKQRRTIGNLPRTVKWCASEVPNAYTLVFIGSVGWVDEPSFLGGWFSAMVKDIDGSKEFCKGLTRCTPTSELGKGSPA